MLIFGLYLALKRIYTSLSLLFFLLVAGTGRGYGQFVIKGTVFDSARVNYVGQVTVQSTGGAKTQTDTLGRYTIEAGISDSICFVYNGKATPKYPVRNITDYSNFDIALLVPIYSKYKIIKGVTVFSKTYRQDSLENRNEYGDIFDFQRPGVQSSMVNGSAGANLDELINVFRFRRNRNIRNFQRRLLMQEQDKYVDYRFNKKVAGNLTGLKGPALDSFMVIFRPPYEFATQTSLYDFYWYIKMSGEQYRLGIRRNLFFVRQKELFPDTP